MTQPVDPEQPPVVDPKQAKLWGMLCHLLGFATFVVPLGNILGPLVIWLVKKDEIPFVDDQGKESLNFQITMTICAVVSWLTCLFFVGFILLPAVLIFWFIMTIIGAINANDGKRYRYPLTIRFIK